MNRRELQRLVGLMISTGALDVKTGHVDADKLRGRFVIEDGGRRGVKITRMAKGARDVGDNGADGGGKGGKG